MTLSVSNPLSTKYSLPFASSILETEVLATKWRDY